MTWHCSCRGYYIARNRCRTIDWMRLLLYILGGGKSLVLCTCGIRNCLGLFGRRHREREWWWCSKHLQTLLTGLTAVETITKNLALFRVASVKEPNNREQDTKKYQASEKPFNAHKHTSTGTYLQYLAAVTS